MEGAGRRTLHVLCGATHPPSRARFEEECALLGVAMRWVDPHAVEFGDGRLWVDSRRVELPHAALARSGGYTSDRALETLRAYEDLGVRVVDSAESVEKCRDKLVAGRLLAAAGLPVPRTVAVGPGGAMSTESAIETLGGLPIVVKPTRGMAGQGVRLACDATELRAAMHAEGPLLVQEYVPHDYDLRVIVAGGEPLGAIKRVSEVDFRSNIHVGGRAEAARLSEVAALLAVGAAGALGAEVAGVDLLPIDGGWTVLEVNTAPGFHGFERATGVNVAHAIVSHALTS